MFMTLSKVRKERVEGTLELEHPKIGTRKWKREFKIQAQGLAIEEYEDPMVKISILEENMENLASSINKLIITLEGEGQQDQHGKKDPIGNGEMSSSENISLPFKVEGKVEIYPRLLSSRTQSAGFANMGRTRKSTGFCLGAPWHTQPHLEVDRGAHPDQNPAHPPQYYYKSKKISFL
eukprot:Gb_10546 [translate_table: standard]